MTRTAAEWPESRLAGCLSATDFDAAVTGNKLVFDRVGDQYFLKEVVTSHGKLHFAVSRKEKELVRNAEAESLRITNAN